MAGKSPDFYKAAWRAIRRDVSFRIDLSKKLTPAQKGIITRYYEQIKSQTGFRPTYRYTSRSKSNLEAVQKYTAQEKGFPRLKAAYIPIPNGSGKPKIKIRKGQVTVITNSGKDGEIERVGYLFENYGGEYEGLSDGGYTIRNADDVVNAILKADDGQSKSFKMMCGPNESSESVSKKFVNETVKRYLTEYDNAHKWFFGIIGYSFSGQASFAEYQNARKVKPRAPKANPKYKRKRKLK